MIQAQTETFANLEIPRQFGNYTAEKVIGQGSTCVVLEAFDRLTGKDYAVKVMSTPDLESRGIISKVRTELSILGGLSHPHVIQFREVIGVGDLIFVVTENCTGGDLLTSITDGRITSRATLRRLFTEICLGVQYLHDQGIAHNDLKPENVIIDSNGRAKLIDFGYAKTEATADDDQKSGTLMYAAPELFQPGCYLTQKADIWALGIVLYTMATGRFPYSGTNDRQVMRQILQGQLRYTPAMDPQVSALVRRMTKVNPNERPTIDEVLQDPFFEEETEVHKKTSAEIGSITDSLESELELVLL
jgi:serine/threonine protein kinase